MEHVFRCGRDLVTLSGYDEADVFASRFPEPKAEAQALVAASLANPLGASPLREAVKARRAGEVVIVVSDITRPIPYYAFLPALVGELEAGGVDRSEITLLVATGMHRPSTPAEHAEMFGAELARTLRIVDHRAEEEGELESLPTPSVSGARVRLNARYLRAGFKLVTGLVEPHFMAGFSGGRKAVCPGLASLETVRNFHGHPFLANPRATNGVLAGNPLHDEALSVAKIAGVDFSVNVVLNDHRRVVAAFSGGLEEAHEAACAFAAGCTLKKVAQCADVVVTSCGGYPLDATFYQCVKGMVSCLPAVKPGGTLIAFAGVAEGIGGSEFTRTLGQYGHRWRDFLSDIARAGVFTKDQWQFQMLGRSLERVGLANLHFLTPGLSAQVLAGLPVTGHAVEAARMSGALGDLVGRLLPAGGRLAVFPEGPYCGAIA
ncbi:MAG: nickel-dependent lactate racemase [Spirochaetes bacterium]|nr:nickel-dependent lactate racemase [Spirochaetota bacterium]